MSTSTPVSPARGNQHSSLEGKFSQFRLLCAGLCVLLTAACRQDPVSAANNPEQLRQRARAFYQALYSSSPASVDAYVASSYREHQVSAGFTLAGLKAYAQNRPGATAGRLVIHRTLVQGDLVGLHLEEKVAADSSVARMALLRFDQNGRITDHWEAAQGQPRRRANPNTMFDGAGVNYQSGAGPRHLDALVVADGRIFNQYDTLTARQSRDAAYIQHNPLAGNGPDALIGLLMFLKSQGIKTTATLHQKLAKGDFVMELNNYQTTPAFPGFANSIGFDLIRVNEAGKAAEHWDVIEELGGADKSRVF